MKRIVPVLALFLTFTTIGKIEAQEVTVRIEGFGYGTIAGINIECPVDAAGLVTGAVGEIITCPIWAHGPDGDFMPASFTPAPLDATYIRATVTSSTPDSLGNHIHPDTLNIEVLRPGRWFLDLHANPILHILGYMYNRPADAPWPRMDPAPIRAVVGETFMLCAYEGGWGARATMKSYERPIPCPDLVEGRPLPEFHVTWTLDGDVLQSVVDPEVVPMTRIALGVRNGNLQVKWANNTQHPVRIRSIVPQ